MIEMRARQRGVALIVALLVVALATVLIAALLDRGELANARTRNTLREMQAESYAKGLEDYAAHVLNQQQNSADTSDSVWAIPLPPTPVPGGEISATMTDLNGRFNLNNLWPDSSNSQQQFWLGKFQTLLTALKLDPNLAQNVEDWMNSDPASGSSDAWYVAQAVPYRSSKRIFTHISELRLVKGFDGNVYQQILAHVSALPVGTTINVNTASVPVLRTLNPSWTDQDAAAVWRQGHANYQDWSGLPTQIPTAMQQGFSFQSSYFLARCDVTLDGLPFTFYSLIERNSSGSTGVANGIRVLLRNRGGD
jgi:general secretion pathway protein K